MCRFGKAGLSYKLHARTTSSHRPSPDMYLCGLKKELWQASLYTLLVGFVVEGCEVNPWERIFSFKNYKNESYKQSKDPINNK